MRQVWHPWTDWECYPAGMFDGDTDMSPEEARMAYAAFLRDIPRFRSAMDRVMREWPKSCEHFLTNENTNRVAWLGQASMCIETGVSRKHRGGFMLMTQDECRVANDAAQQALNQWLKNYARKDRAVRERMEAPRLFDGHTG